MRESRALFDQTKSSSSRFDIVIEWLVVALLVFMPLAFGVVHAWSERVVIALSGAIIVCFLLKLVFDPGAGIVWSWAYVPLGLFVLVAVVQLITLPAWLVSIISPNTVALRTQLLSGLPNAEASLKSMTLSLYPNATKHDLRLLLSAVGIFVVVLNVLRRSDQIERLLTAIAIIGGTIAVFALVQGLFENGRIYWFVPTAHRIGFSGPFINHSHFSQFMNLSIGAALGLLLVRLHRVFAGRNITLPIVFDHLSSPSGRTLWLLVAVISLGMAAVFISLSRGGIISTLLAMTFTTLAITSQRSVRTHGWIMVGIGVVAFVCVLYIGFDAVYERMATLRDFNQAGADRLQILRDIIHAWVEFPVQGTGLGTHSTVYPMFDHSTITALATHAENEYAQVLEETGLVGLGLLMIFGAVVWSNYGKLVGSVELPIQSAAYGLGFGLFAILIHSLSDFGQHLPANGFLSAIFCGLLLGLARLRKNRTAVGEEKASSGKFKVLRSRVVRIAVLLGVLGIWSWALIGANNSRNAEAHWAQARTSEKLLAKQNWQGTDAEYEDLIFHAARASAFEPDNVKYRYWLNVYRWHSIDQARAYEPSGPAVDENSIPAVRDIVEQLYEACVLCPTYGPIYSTVGQIEKYVLNNDSGADRIRKGFQLARCDPVACFMAGCLDVQEGKYEDCVAKFERAVELDGRTFKGVVEIYVNYLSRPRLAISAAKDNVGRLRYVANVLTGMQYYDLARQCRERMKILLEAECNKPDVSASSLVSLARVYGGQEDKKAAIELYHRALALDYSHLHWRLELAKLFAESGKIPEALDEAKKCLRLHPGFKPAEKLVADYSVRPEAWSAEP